MASVDITFLGNLAQVDSVADLRAVPVSGLADNDAYLIARTGLYSFDSDSLETDDGVAVIKPNALTPLQAGRWILAGSDLYARATFITNLASATGATLVGYGNRTVDAVLDESIRVLDYYLTGDAGDYGPAISRAFAAAQGALVTMPGGTYAIKTPINYLPYSSGPFVPGPKLRGAGKDVTILDNQVSNTPMIAVDSNPTNIANPTPTTVNHTSAFLGVLDGCIEDLSIKRLTSGSAQTGIYLRTCFNFQIRNVRIDGINGTGVRVPCQNSDNDASNGIEFDNVRIENCPGWGVNIGDPGNNEISFTQAEHLNIQNCGAPAANYIPDSGGMKWAGQIFNHRNCFFTLNNQVAMWIPGQAGLPTGYTPENLTFENNRGKSLFCRGIINMKGRNLQFYNNETYTATHGMHLEFGSFAGVNINIDSVLVRATAANAITEFKLEGANAQRDSIRVREVYWDNFDFAGQKRFEGFAFDAVPDDCILAVLDAQTIALRPLRGTGTVTPLRKAGPSAQTAGTPTRSTTGEWIADIVPTNGRVATRAGAIDRATNAGLVADTTYFVYYYESAGQKLLGFDSVNGPVTDMDAGVDFPGSGYLVRNGDPTWRYAGRVVTDGTGAFRTTALGWLSPERVYDGATQTGVPYYRWTDSTLRLRVKASLPTNDTDGTIVGVQT